MLVDTERPLTRAMELPMTQADQTLVASSKQIMSRRIAITGMCVAVAVPVTVAATSGAPTSTCSYPDLAEKLDAVRRRYIAQHERRKAMGAAGRAYATAKTGITEDDARADQRDGLNDRTEDGPKWNAWFGAWNEYSDAHDDDPVDEHGSSIEWTQISDEQGAVCRSIMAQPVISAADMGLMAQAYATLNACDFSDPRFANDSREARQLAEAVCKFCGVEAILGLEYPPLLDDEEAEG